MNPGNININSSSAIPPDNSAASSKKPTKKTPSSELALDKLNQELPTPPPRESKRRGVILNRDEIKNTIFSQIHKPADYRQEQLERVEITPKKQSFGNKIKNYGTQLHISNTIKKEFNILSQLALEQIKKWNLNRLDPLEKKENLLAQIADPKDAFFTSMVRDVLDKVSRAQANYDPKIPFSDDVLRLFTESSDKNEIAKVNAVLKRLIT